jgi:hypothetical protein
MICPICQSKFKNDKNYIMHLEKKHKTDNDCGCDGEKVGGGTVRTSEETSGTTQLEKSIEKARKKVEMVEKSMNMNALEFGLKMKKKELDKIPVDVRDKVKNLLLENQYLRGVIDGNNKQIQIMKKQVELCISLASPSS